MYSVQALKEAITFNSVEVLPGEEQKLESEIEVLVSEANQSGQKIRHYIGFEISGKVHLGTGIMTALKIKKLQEAGVQCSLFLADYHTWLNRKLDGKMETIRRVAKDYFAEIMLACIEAVGGESEKVEIVFAQTEYQKNKDGFVYWDYMLKVSQNLTLSRVIKSVSITGKEAGEGVEFGTLCYPVMQVADAFFMQTHLVQAGIDQRKCHVLMREIALKMDEGFGLKIGQKTISPIAIHHKLLLSLGISAKDTQKRMDPGNEDLKMSKSKPDSAVWVHDDLESINRKFKKAYCPMPDIKLSLEENKEIQAFNPILNWCELIIFPANLEIFLERPEKFGGNVTYNSYEVLYSEYLEGKIHPLDLKNGVARSLAELLKPIYKIAESKQEIISLIETIKK